LEIVRCGAGEAEVEHHAAALKLGLNAISADPAYRLELVRRQLGLADGVLDVPMQPAGVVALVGHRVTAGVAEHVGWTLSSIPAAKAARRNIWPKPAGVNGAPRSETKTNGDLGPLLSLQPVETAHLVAYDGVA
jgi:hypothetical protein